MAGLGLAACGAPAAALVSHRVPASTAAPTPAGTPAPILPATAATAAPVASPTAVASATPRPAATTAAPRRVPVATPVPTPAPTPAPTPSSYPADHLVGPGVDVLVSPMPAYDCSRFSPPLPDDRVEIDPCAQPVTGVPLIVGHNYPNLLWDASVGWGNGTVVHYGGHAWRIAQTRVVDHWITYYPMPPAGAGLQIRTCQPDGMHEWVWDLVRQP